MAEAKKPLAFETPGFDKWTKEVAALSAEMQVEAVAKKLQELNPGFDGKVTHQGVWAVTDLVFFTDKVSDISPVRALVELKTLKCNGSGYGTGTIADLSPLNGLRLMDLDFQLYSGVRPVAAQRNAPHASCLRRYESGRPVASEGDVTDGSVLFYYESC